MESLVSVVLIAGTLILVLWLPAWLIRKATKAIKRGKPKIEAADHAITITLKAVGCGPGDIPVGETDDRDAWEGYFEGAVNPKKCPAHIAFEYTDGKGRQTRRSVVVREFDNDLNGGMLIGLCELRDATRTFWFDRMRNVVDADTGEVIGSVREFLNYQYSISPQKTIADLETTHWDLLAVLLYMARSDGQFVQKEKVVIMGYLKVLTKDARMTAELVADLFRDVQTPSLQTFRLALGRVLRSGQYDLNQLAICCRSIVGAQKTIHPNEQAALDEIERKIAASVKGGA